MRRTPKVFIDHDGNEYTNLEDLVDKRLVVGE
jgi:hypothetical protein